MHQQWLCAALAVASLAGTQALGQTVIHSDAPLNPTPPASFQASVVYDATLSQLQFDILNTSPFDNGGFLTGFVFNVPAGVRALYNDVLPGEGFDQVSGVTVLPYGTFSTGVALGKEFFEGGNPENGLFPTESQTFFFNITLDGTPAGDLLNVQDFLSLATQDGEEPAVMVARFREFDSGGDQLAPALIPLPMAAWSALSGMGLLAVPTVLRRVRRGM